MTKKITLFILSGLFSFLPLFGQSKPAAKEPKAQTEPRYVITEHTVVPSKSSLPSEDLFVIRYGDIVLRVKYSESQTSSRKPTDFPAEPGLHSDLTGLN